MTDTNALANVLGQAPAKLSRAMTFLGGKEDGQFPLQMLTEGLGSTRSIPSLEYEYDVHMRVNGKRRLARTMSATAMGAGGALFHLAFDDRWFIRQYTLVSKSNVHLRIMGDPIPDGSVWLYPVQCIEPDTEFPASDLVGGVEFAQLFAAVGVDFSRGNASNTAVPGKVRHKLTTIRKSYQFAGNVRHEAVQFDLPSQNGTTRLWMDYEEWQHFLAFKQETELYLWYGRQSYTEAGVTLMKDENGQPVVIGPGLLQQIQNVDTYSVLTASKIKQVIRNAFYGMKGAQNKQITLYTGIGGAEEFDRAMKEELISTGFNVISDGKFIDGSGRAMSLTGFFTTYQHIDGYTVNVVKNPMFDHGPVAEVSARHPVTGLPLESYRMVFLDQSNYDGEPNVVVVQKEKRELKRWCVAGSVVPIGAPESNILRASDEDGASVHFLKTAGVCLKRFDTSIDLRCVAS